MKAYQLISPSSLIIVIVCFFFTFTDLKCNDKVLFSIKGIDMVTGKKLDANDLTGGFGKGMKDLMNIGGKDDTEENADDVANENLADEETTADSEENSEQEKAEENNSPAGSVSDDSDKSLKPNPYAIAAVALALAGIFVSFATTYKTRVYAGVSIALLGALALLLLKYTIEKSMEEKMGDAGEMAMLMNITFEFQPAYYLALLGFAVAAVFFILAYNDELREKKLAADSQKFYVEVEQPVSPDTDVKT